MTTDIEMPRHSEANKVPTQCGKPVKNKWQWWQGPNQLVDGEFAASVFTQQQQRLIQHRRIEDDRALCVARPVHIAWTQFVRACAVSGCFACGVTLLACCVVAFFVNVAGGDRGGALQART